MKKGRWQKRNMDGCKRRELKNGESRKRGGKRVLWLKNMRQKKKIISYVKSKICMHNVRCKNGRFKLLA